MWISRRRRVSTQRSSIPRTASGAGAGGDRRGAPTADVFSQAEVEIEKLTTVTDKINTGILSEANQRNIADTLANLKGTSQHFDEASKNLDAMIQNANGAVNSAKETMGTVNAAAADVHTAIDDAKTTLAAVRDLLARRKRGMGRLRRC